MKEIFNDDSKIYIGQAPILDPLISVVQMKDKKVVARRKTIHFTKSFMIYG